MGVSKNEDALIPAAGPALRTLVLHGKESWEQRDKSLALALAPVTPDPHLPGIRRVVSDLSGPGKNHDADGDVSLCEFLPQKSHSLLALGDAALHAKRCIAGNKGVRFIDLPVGPSRALPVERVAIGPCSQLIISVTDKTPLEMPEDVVGEREVLRDTEAPLREAGQDPVPPLRPSHG